MEQRADFPQILAIYQAKGGVGKTVSTISIGTELAARGYRVLLVDNDPQSTLTHGMGIDPKRARFSLHEVYLNPERSPDHAIWSVPVEVVGGHGVRVDVLPSRLDAIFLEDELLERYGKGHERHMLLRRALDLLRPRYEVILIDCGPSFTLSVRNALHAADAVLSPVQAEPAAYDGAELLPDTIKICQDGNPRLHLLGLFLTMYDLRMGYREATELAADLLRRRFGRQVFSTTIPRNVRVSQAYGAGQPLQSFAPESSAGLAYTLLTTELLERVRVPA
jgi:chromosome partitioning protein